MNTRWTDAKEYVAHKRLHNFAKKLDPVKYIANQQQKAVEAFKEEFKEEQAWDGKIEVFQEKQHIEAIIHLSDTEMDAA